MQYLVREVRPNVSSGARGAMIFKTLPDAVKYLQKINNEEKLVLQEKEGTLAQLETYLKERLSTVSLRTNLEENRQWVITAFE